MGGRAQSESIGILLLTFVIVVTVGVGGAVMLGGVADDADSASSPLVDAVIEVTANEITVTYGGGDPVTQSAVTVVLRGDTRTERYSLDDANLSGDDDETFEVTERFQRDHDLVGPSVDVLVVHGSADTILAQQVFDVGTYGDQLPPIARFDTDPAHPDPGESFTLDASASDYNDGTIGEYRWDLGDGTTPTGETVSHTYDTEGNYTVSLTVEDDAGATVTTNTTYWITPLRFPDAPDGVVGGLDYSYYEAGPIDDLGDLQRSAIVRNGTTSDFDISLRDRDDNFGFRYTGYVEVPENGEYTFYTDSDDGSRLYIGDELVVDNPGLHAANEASGTVQLQDGRHAITVTVFEHTGVETLDVRWNGPGISGAEPIPESRLYRNATSSAAFTDNCVGLSCTFDASGSTAPGSSIDSYRWNVSGDVTTTSDPTLDYDFAGEGTYDVNLTVTTTDGRTDSVNRTVTVETLRPADDPGGLSQGIAYDYYEADDEFTSIPGYESLTPTRAGTTDQIDLDPSYRNRDFAFVYTGYLEVPRDDSYTLYTDSDDGSELYVGDELVVENGGLHVATTESGTIGLEEGRHEITVANLYRVPGPTASFTDDGDGTYETTTTSATTDHSYDSGDTYEVTPRVTDDEGRTDTVARDVTAVDPRPDADPDEITDGVAYSYYETDSLDNFGAFTPSNIVRNGTHDRFDLDPDHSEENYGFRYTGYVSVPETGNYTFYTTSDDGSELSIGDQLLVDNGGTHSNRTRSGEIALEAGRHPITVRFFGHTINDGLVVEYEGPSLPRQEIPAESLSRDS